MYVRVAVVGLPEKDVGILHAALDAEGVTRRFEKEPQCRVEWNRRQAASLPPK